MLRLVAALVLSFAAAPAAAQTTGVLELGDVLAASAARYPEIVEAMARREAAVGEAFASRGAFDLVFEAENKSLLSGYYDGVESAVGVSREIGAFGARAYGGYRVSRGLFPVYRDAAYTDRSGEAKVGVIFSLLRDREFDDRRLALRNADISAVLAEFDLAITRVSVQKRAADAYFRWVAAGRQASVYDDLVKMAERRQDALRREVESGARARIFLTENEQNLARRRVLALEAQQRFAIAANELSLFLRDESGDPVTAGIDALPMDRQDPRAQFGFEADVSRATDAIARRPDLARYDGLLKQARNRLNLARNNLLPKLDVAFEFSNDFGDVGAGGRTRDGAESFVGLKLSVPLQRRKARGDLAVARAELEAFEQDRRLAEDSAQAQLRNIVLELDMSRQRALLVAHEVAQAKQMEEAERRRFSEGASDFFLVNIREEAAADALARLHGADLDRAFALSAFLAATVDFKALGLDDGIIDEAGGSGLLAGPDFAE